MVAAAVRERLEARLRSRMQVKHPREAPSLREVVEHEDEHHRKDTTRGGEEDGNRLPTRAAGKGSHIWLAIRCEAMRRAG